MYPAALTVASDGPAGTLVAAAMGVFLKRDRQQYNNRPVYQLDRGGVYLFYEDNGFWMIGPTVGGSNRGIITVRRGLLTPPATGWKYSDNGWKEDPQLTVSGETINMFGVCH